MPVARVSASFVGIAMLALAAGCAEESPAPVAVKATPVAAKPSQAAAKPEPAAEEESAAAEALAAYDAPFANRTNLFAPMQRQKPAQSKDRDSGDSVVLKGFADVGEPCAVLRIEGHITPLAVGGAKYGVQVISIDPPQCVLQRGRTRWTTSL